MSTKPHAPHRKSERELTWDEIEELGLEEAPDGIGPSWEEIREARNRGRTGNGTRNK